MYAHIKQLLLFIYLGLLASGLHLDQKAGNVSKGSSKQYNPSRSLSTSEKSARHHLKHHEAKRKILIVIPVGPSNVDVFFQNLKYFPPKCCKFELFPYSDEALKVWHSQHTSERLSRLIPGSVNVSVFGTREGRKHELVAEAVRSTGSRLLQYNWVMLVDDDIDFSHMDVKRFWYLAEASKAQIVAPSMKFSRYWSTFMQPHGNSKLCNNSLYRYTNFVEVQAPMFRPSALRIVVKELMFPLIQNESRSDWGMDNIWCTLIAHKMNWPIRKTCAVVDEESAVHLDSRTGEIATDNFTKADAPKLGDRQIEKFRNKFPEYFVEQHNVIEFQCCAQADCSDDD